MCANARKQAVIKQMRQERESAAWQASLHAKVQSRFLTLIKHKPTQIFRQVLILVKFYKLESRSWLVGIPAVVQLKLKDFQTELLRGSAEIRM